MDLLDGLLQQTYFDNSLLQWSSATVLACMIYAGATLARRVARKRYRQYAQTPATEMLEVPLRVASHTHWLPILLAALFAGASVLELSAGPRHALNSIVTVALFWQVGVWASTAALAWIEHKRRLSMDSDRAAVGTLGIVGIIARVLIWTMVLLLVLDNLGVNITALVAGLGVGGVAVALAVQNILGDLFASISITLDKPFVIGDFVIVDDFMGSVEYIGIKTTRLRSLSGEQIVMSNADLLKSRLRNYGRMVERRVVFTLNLTYETPRATLKRVPGIIKAIVETQPDARFDRSHFTKFGASSLDFETVYYVRSADYTRYADIQQEINFRIHEAFEAEGIEFAYPTQKLWLTRLPSAAGHAEQRPRMARAAR